MLWLAGQNELDQITCLSSCTYAPISCLGQTNRKLYMVTFKTKEEGLRTQRYSNMHELTKRAVST